METEKILYAHSKEGLPTTEWHLLDDHLKNVGAMASDFAGLFNAGSWGKIAGEYHDLGKSLAEWQAYLRHVNDINDDYSKHYRGRIPHAIHGARKLFFQSKEAGKLLSYCIAGHHTGLSNWIDEAEKGLKEQLKKARPDINLTIKDPVFEKNLPLKNIDQKRFGFQLQFFVRMLFSCLVDADYLDTEAALDRERAKQRSVQPSLKSLYDRFWKNINILRQNANLTDVNRQREIVLQNCLTAAKSESGLFSLTVPTGGGKTLASLAFALEHSRFHEFMKQRIIYVIPFTTIIEQNAAVFRKVLGEDAVLEHHCNFIPDETDWKTRLASENWDAPLIVTTNVQFFDSFFSRKPSTCRKLHNVANSIVIFDEVQTIPVEKLKPCLETLRELSLNYGVTAVLCTATQPAIDASGDFPSGLKNIIEIIQGVPGIFHSLRRTREIYIGEITQTNLAEKLCEHPQVLCIVNTRRQAREIFDLLPKDEGNFHLSARMYPAHRSRVLKEIRNRLENNLTCRVVSTQLIEAGVDIDFPVVYRAVAGMDAIAQAAGRCNREGNIQQGTVYIFKLENGLPPGYFRQTAQCAESLFEKFADQYLGPECIREYFLTYYWLNEDRMDSSGILQKCLQGGNGNFQFKDIAEFQMIENLSISIIVAVEEEAASLVGQLAFVEKKGMIFRKLQKYSVQIYKQDFYEIKDWLESPIPGVFVVRNPELYSKETGLKTKPPEGTAFFI